MWVTTIGTSEEEFLRNHTAHAAGTLLAEWAELAKRRGWWETNLGGAASAPYPVPLYATRVPEGTEAFHYLSAGIHGDEPGAVAAMWEWVSARVEWVSQGPFVLIPCWNPVGLAAATRNDEHGLDRNRSFSRRELPHVVAFEEFLQRVRLREAIALHEDYEARGTYAYCSDALSGRVRGALEAARGVIPLQPDGIVDEHVVERGIISMERITKLPVGTPESRLVRDVKGCGCAVVESPSQWSLYRRIRFHTAFLDAVYWENGEGLVVKSEFGKEFEPAHAENAGTRRGKGLKAEGLKRSASHGGEPSRAEGGRRNGEK